ncbi:MAG: hypothetical protein AAF500_03785 [Myxococcota bacterium]
MLSWLIRRKIDGFEEEYGYDMDYMRTLLDTSLDATLRFHKATGLGEFREGLPDDVWHAARILASRREDCGPCTQLVTTMAERAGVPASVIRGALRGEYDNLSGDVQLSLVFVDAVLDHDVAADDLRSRVVERFGERGLVSLAFAMLSVRLYPTLKYTLGYGHTCTVVRVAGEAVPTP